MTVSELVAQSRELVPHRAVLDSAEHVLVIARGKPFGREQAFHEVLSVAIRNRIEVLTLARALIDVSESRDYRTIPTDTAHTVAVLEWGELLEIPTEHHEKSKAESAGDIDESSEPDDPIEPEYLVETDMGGRVVFVALAFTVGGIVGFFAHDWALLLLITAVYLVWIAARLVAKLVSVSRSAHWADASPIRSTEATTHNAENPHRHAVAA
ncbi:MAG: hypothetical protein U5O16_40150 [Rhodococcus sp. (in: high G+C Gram-positive bacteria)]|uniref:hypothetical protein n=1 Tax=Rhodococcus sp. TaxID=1831 RepID=UPI002AD63EE5|nr:hypothetical protein [Rhodococcus sp. (in: high G+C Gram-positive bacteria)]